MLLDEINIRDPYILVHDNKYYLYGTRSASCWGEAFGFDCYVSEDLKKFEGPFEIFNRPGKFFATKNYWAPECYEYNNKFYLLTTLGGDAIKKGIYLLISESPTGPFSLYTDRLTPDNWTCIDGTLFFENNHVYLVYSHSFEDTPDADICFQELSSDLKKTTTAPQKLFAAKEATWARPVPFAKAEFGMDGDVYFSDGPCLFKMDDGKLYMTWSSWSEKNYAVGVAFSESGDIMGPWKQIETPLFKEDGGHGMVFKALDNSIYFCLHNPNEKLKEHPCIYKMSYDNGTIALEND